MSTVVWILAIIIAAVLLLKFLGKMLSFILSAVGIVTVVWLVIIGLRYLDESDMRNNLLESNSLFVLDDGGSPITGFATKEGFVPDINEAYEEMPDSSSDIYQTYYKVFVVKKEALPEKIALMMEVSDDEDKLNMFRHYVDNNLLQGNFTTRLIEAEQEGKLDVYKETLAFKHGLKDLLP